MFTAPGLAIKRANGEVKNNKNNNNHSNNNDDSN